jgi:hypothetical protein
VLQDGMVYHHEVLEHGDFNQRQQVVRWIRRFPFAFLSDREYTIARREFREDDGSIYACTKVGVVGGFLVPVLVPVLSLLWGLSLRWGLGKYHACTKVAVVDGYRVVGVGLC